MPGDGARLPLRSWLPKDRVRAVVVALHGMNDYSHAFAMPGEYFASLGIAVYAYDQRGFGAAPQPGIWPGEDNLVADLRGAVRAAKVRHPNAPLFVLGESMGGAVAIATLAAADAPEVRGVILSAPAVWSGQGFALLLKVPLWVGAHSIPWKEFTGEGLDVLASDNIPMLRALGRDPLVIKSTRLDAIYGMVGLMERAYADAERLKVPTLLLYGENDEVIPPEGVFEVGERLEKPSDFYLYPRGWHLLLRDLRADVVWNDVAHWVLTQ